MPLSNPFTMKYPQIVFLSFLFLLPISMNSQYTDVINSNRPGQSVSAYAVGKNVLQAEIGSTMQKDEHVKLFTESDFLGIDIALRYGLFFESLEIYYEGSYVKEDIFYTQQDLDLTRKDFTRNRLGLKYLLYNPFKNPESNKPNLYSWKANHGFKLKSLIPAISIYAGANFVLGENPYYSGDPIVSPRVMLTTQSRLSSRFVLISNIAYDRIGTDFPEMSYIVSVSHALGNPKWSVFLEHQGIKSDRYADAIVRTGVAYLFNKNFQADINIATNFKNTPSKQFGTVGFSYRLDMHRDALMPIEDQNDGENGSISSSSMKKSKKKKKKNKNNDETDF